MTKTQGDAVAEVMRANNGYATLGYLYQNVLKTSQVKWGTKTPHESIRRILQKDAQGRFFKIKPGLWALEAYRGKIPFLREASEDAPEPQQEKFTHGYFQGLLIEIGNLQKLTTYVPPQDRNRTFLKKPLGTITTAPTLYPFSHDEIIRFARTVDVIWFNERNMPHAFIEVEHSTDIYNSLRKFVELQDFYADFTIVAPETRKKEFEDKTSATSYREIRDRVKFWGYDDVSRRHANLAESVALNYSL